ncbi:hypothetical protein [Anaerocolumna aminovalerica]|uniref:hypothetical protein n=1 Tax=Anaerocolumna aminovalerica TaxID=1527 RepID=UPI0015964066|nr:hypothetical protein [Anaerocolumna aminovalerica]
MIKNNNKYKKYMFYSILSFLFFGFGISLQLKAAIGQSVINALAVTLSDTIQLKVGTILNVINSLFFVVLVCQTYVTPYFKKFMRVVLGDFHPRGLIGKLL